MESTIRRTCIARSAPRLLALVLGAAVASAGCDLGVTDPDVVTPDQSAGPSAVRNNINGAIGAFQEAFDGHVRYSGLLVDEFIASGTFPAHQEVDERRINADNSAVTDFTSTGDGNTTGDGLYEPIHAARKQADDIVANFRSSLEDPAFADVVSDLQEGIAVGLYYGAYARILLAETYCASALEDGAPLSSDDRMQEALGLFEDAEAAAVEADLEDLARAARVGQARALAWSGDLEAAAGAAASVPSDFELLARYSTNTANEENEVNTFTDGLSFTGLRWTVGAGTSALRHEEKYAHFDEFVDEGLIDPDPGLEAFDETIPVSLQLKYPTPDADIPIATGWEARTIEAEERIRAGDPDGAAAIVDPLLAGRDFAESNFTGDLANDLRELARVRAVGLWLTGTRLGTARRLLGDGVNLYPQGKPGTDISFPIPQQELDNNPNVDEACPFGDRRE